MRCLALTDPAVAVIGAGPAGLLVARSVKSVEVTVLEASRRIGWPPHCTGIVSGETAWLIGVREAVREEYACAVFHGPGWGELCRVCRPRLAVRLDRPLLEETLASIVEDRGHRVLRGVRVVSWSRSGNVFRVEAKGVVLRPRMLVVAGGASMAPSGCKLAVGVEVRVEVGRRLVEDEFHTFHLLPGTRGGYGWLVPVDGGRRALVGVASLDSRGLGYGFEHMVRLVERMYGVSSMVSRRSGLLALGPPQRTPWRNGAIHIGDAACLSKPFTGGGLYAIARLAPAVAAYIDGAGGHGLEEAWAAVAGELERQRLLAEGFRSLAATSKPLALKALKAVCACSPDFDRHSTSARMLSPWGC